MADKQATEGLKTDRAARQIDRQNAIEKINGQWTDEMLKRQKAESFALMQSHQWEKELGWFLPTPTSTFRPPDGRTVGR